MTFLPHKLSHAGLVKRQLRRMQTDWPGFILAPTVNSIYQWRGRLAGFQREYTIGILWDSASSDLPYVYLLDPPLSPRAGGTFEEIPHLIFDRDNPELSGLCLFDPEGREWSPRRMIAETTLPWAAEWLYFYEFWRVDGVWRGGGVGPESVAKMNV